MWVRGGPPKSPQSWGDFKWVANGEWVGWGGVGPLNPPYMGDVGGWWGCVGVVMVGLLLAFGAAWSKTARVLARRGRVGDPPLPGAVANGEVGAGPTRALREAPLQLSTRGRGWIMPGWLESDELGF